MWISGFDDGEGSFMVRVFKDPRMKQGWRVSVLFSITLRKKDRALLELVQSYFEIGKIYNNGLTKIEYKVTSMKGLELLIRHFDRYPLITHKLADFLLWRKVISMMHLKEHLTREGLQSIVNIRASINLGLPESLKEAFPDTVGVMRPKVVNKIRDPQWLAGFTSAEGCFSVFVHKSTIYKLGKAVQLRFTLSQHLRDAELMKSLYDYLGCGKFEKVTAYGGALNFHVYKFSDIREKIIPFFREYPIIGVKSEDFKSWCNVADLIEEKKHLTVRVRPYL